MQPCCLAVESSCEAICNAVQSREEGVALAVQLAECKERTRQAENSADDAGGESRALREQLEEAGSQMQQMQQRLVDTAANCRRSGPACSTTALYFRGPVTNCLSYYLPLGSLQSAHCTACLYYTTGQQPSLMLTSRKQGE